MIFFTILNAGLSAAVAALLVYKLLCHSQRCSFMERAGIAFVASGMVLNIGPIIAKAGFSFGGETPFDDWAASLLRIGLLIYFTARVLIHWNNNQAHIQMNRRG